MGYNLNSLKGVILSGSEYRVFLKDKESRLQLIWVVRVMNLRPPDLQVRSSVRPCR